jgi:hypothetical protein
MLVSMIELNVTIGFAAFRHSIGKTNKYRNLFHCDDIFQF